MKIKGGIYFILALAGVVVLVFGTDLMPREYALSIGIVLLMFGLYKISTSWQKDDSDEATDD